MNAIINKDSIGVYLNGNMYTIKSDYPFFDQIKTAIKNKNECDLEILISKINAINNLSDNKVYVENGVVKYNGKIIDNVLSSRIISLISEGFSVDSLIKFMENLYQNPSETAISELYDFLSNFALPITEDGCFLAYKAITNDFKDIYTRTISNNIGDEPTIDRSLVDADRYNHCSTGLHVGALGYVKQYGHCIQKPTCASGNRIVIVKVNPKDAVSVPNDSQCQKLRVCKYKVICELSDYNKALERVVYTADATEKTPDNTHIHTNKSVPDSDYFEGRYDGELDRFAGIEYQYQHDKSKKYNRGYKNSYK